MICRRASARGPRRRAGRAGGPADRNGWPGRRPPGCPGRRGRPGRFPPARRGPLREPVPGGVSSRAAARTWVASVCCLPRSLIIPASRIRSRVGDRSRSARSSWPRRSRKSVSTLWWKPGAVQVHREGVRDVDPTPHRLYRLPAGAVEQEPRHTHGGRLGRGEAGTAIAWIPGGTLVVPEPVEVVPHPHGRGPTRIAGPCRPSREFGHRHAGPRTNGHRSPREDRAVRDRPKHPEPPAPLSVELHDPRQSRSVLTMVSPKGFARCGIIYSMMRAARIRSSGGISAS